MQQLFGSEWDNLDLDQSHIAYRPHSTDAKITADWIAKPVTELQDCMQVAIKKQEPWQQEQMTSLVGFPTL